MARRSTDSEFIQDHGGIVDIGAECFGVADGTILNWRGQNYVPQRPTLRVRLHNFWVAWKSRGFDQDRRP